MVDPLPSSLPPRWRFPVSLRLTLPINRRRPLAPEAILSATPTTRIATRRTISITLMCSTTVFPRTVSGSMMITMATYFSLRWRLTTATGAPMPMGTGSGLTVAGSGPRMKISDGHATTTAAGFASPAWVGSGFQAAIGRQPGSPGGRATITRAGLPYHQNPAFPLVIPSASRTGAIHFSTSVRQRTSSSGSATGFGQVTGVTLRRLTGT